MLPASSHAVQCSSLRVQRSFRSASAILVASEGLRPSDSPTRSLARPSAGAPLPRGSLAVLARAAFVSCLVVLLALVRAAFRVMVQIPSLCVAEANCRPPVSHFHVALPVARCPWPVARSLL